jgi:putative two-component system response regulator
MSESPTEVLVVDDEQMIRRSLTRILERRDYECSTAGSVDAAIETLEDGDIPLVLTDLRMPGKNGLQLVDWVSDRSPETVVVAVTAVDNTSLAVDALDRGAYAYVVKPFEPTEIVTQTESALRRRKLELHYRQTQEELREQVREQTEMLRSSREELAMRLMTASHYRDIETGEHIRRTGIFAAALADELGWEAERVDDLRVAAPMHDIGKLGIPDEILLKPGDLDEDEWEMMKQHTVIGGDILAEPNTAMMEMARTIALQHHEQWDGGGYPDGLEGEEIAEEARIVAVIDVFDALIHERPYRGPWDEEDALDLLREERGSHFEPELVDLFIGNLSELKELEVESEDLYDYVELNWPSYSVR